MLRAADSTWTDVAEFIRAGDGLVILPFGALEQHGPHLPLSTDTLTAVHVATSLAERLDAVLLPALDYGATWNNAGYPGTVTLQPETVTAIAVDVAAALVTAGARALVIVNGDWGNREPLAVASASAELPTLVLNYPGMDDAIAAVRESRPAFAGLNHAEEVETSIVLALAPSLVRKDRYVAEYPAFPDDFGLRPMQLHPFSPSGIFGDPATASAAKGEKILAATIDASEREIRDFLGRRGATT
jgi:creatinine amidohydrolase